MIRYIVLGFGFVSATAVLLFGLGAGKPLDSTPDQVSRSTPGPLTLQPATNMVAAPQINLTPVEPATFEPQAAPVIAPPAPVVAEPVLSTALPIAPAKEEPADEVMDVLRVMSLGIVQELKKPIPENSQAALQQALAQPAPAPTPEPLGRTYTVQAGDSLPGISFRMYGTTSAYYHILQANPDVISSPSEMQAGMVLRIPDLP